MSSRIAPIRIAVADDDPVVCQTFVRLLETLGHRVVCIAYDGQALVDQCVAGEVDLVFTDFHMPRMDGLAAAELIASRGIPVVLVSGHPEADDIVIENEPLVSLLRKPATAEELQCTIRQVIARQPAEWD